MDEPQQRSLREMIRLLRAFEGWRCLWRVLACTLIWGATRLLPVIGATGGIYIGADLKLYRVALGVVASLGSGSIAVLISRRAPWRTLLVNRLWTYEEPNPLGFVELLVRDEDSIRTFGALRRARFAPLYAASVGSPPPDAPDLTSRIGVQEPEAWRQSTSDEDRLRRIATVLGTAGIRARVASLDAFPGGSIEKWAEALRRRALANDGRTTHASSPNLSQRA